MGLLVLPFTLPGIDPDNSEETDREDLSRVRTRPLAPAIVLGLLVVLCISGMLIEDAGFSWATLFMRDYANTGAALAGSGYVVLLSTHALGRFIADPLVGRFGPRAVVAGGGALILVGMGGGLLIGTTPALLFGFATAGIGASASVPLAYNAAHDVRGMDPAVGLTIVSWLGRLAFLVAPPLVGILVQHTSLLSAMLVIPAAGIALMASSLVLAPRRLRVQKLRHGLSWNQRARGDHHRRGGPCGSRPQRNERGSAAHHRCAQALPSAHGLVQAAVGSSDGAASRLR